MVRFCTRKAIQAQQGTTWEGPGTALIATIASLFTVAVSVPAAFYDQRTYRFILRDQLGVCNVEPILCILTQLCIINKAATVMCEGFSYHEVFREYRGDTLIAQALCDILTAIPAESRMVTRVYMRIALWSYEGRSAGSMSAG